ncbi:hypothetical protein WBP07_17800 [Novosphingobium sp. BL-8A]|uniref:hypothetical protein n=1 Tax=Novosphingobium sp. BL-8A TaxID=3127639 RepID=UPI0037584078
MPMSSEDLMKLAAACELSDPAQPNLDLHEAILLAVGWTHRGAELIDPQGQRCMQTPDPLHSVDGAMTLIPDRYRLGTLMEFDGEGRWAAKLFNRGKPGGLPAAGGSSAPIALVVACLRARATQTNGA